MVTNNEIENRFIAEELDIYGENLVDAFIAAIDKRNLIDTGNLIDSFSYKTDYSAKRLSVSFLTYGRIHDLKSKNNILHEAPDTNALIWGIKKTKKRTKKKQWYAKTAYGMLGTLTNTIMYGLSDIERKRIIDQLKNEFTKTTIKL